MRMFLFQISKSWTWESICWKPAQLAPPVIMFMHFGHLLLAQFLWFWYSFAFKSYKSFMRENGYTLFNNKLKFSVDQNTWVPIRWDIFCSFLIFDGSCTCSKSTVGAQLHTSTVTYCEPAVDQHFLFHRRKAFDLLKP